MTRMITLQVTDDIDQILTDDSRRTGKSPEQVALEWIGDQAHRPKRGTVAALMPSFGAWAMSLEVRADIEATIEEERLLEDADR